jgi:Z1 domain
MERPADPDINLKAPAVFLWGNRFHEPTSGAPIADGEWWRQYTERLRISPSALAELSESSRRLMSFLPPAVRDPSYPSPVRGAVVGSVQSGKTAHMLAVTARALDAGYRVVVVLAGLKDDLRAQTARRFNVQLLRQRDPLPKNRGGFTLSEADSNKRVSALAPPYFLDCHQWPSFHIKMGQAISRGIPVVSVIKKNQASLSNMRERIRQAWSRVGVENLPLLVLDDECDEASVEPNQQTPTPELIANLWRPVEGSLLGTVTYIGYTATVAANLLQKADNELYPSDFVYLLRSPSRTESSLTFREPVPEAWYCGGETFYERFIRPVDGGSSLLVEPSVTEEHLADPARNESLKQAVRLFLLGGAIRSLEHPELTLTDPNRHCEPHTMIVQASTAIADHERWARSIGVFLDIGSGDSGASQSALEADLTRNGERWAEALTSIEQSREAVNELQPHPWPLKRFEWPEIWNAILFMAPYVRLRVLNSGPDSVDSLDFEATSDAAGLPLMPRDLLSIIVGGGRLSRGLTIDGLSVSYFSRWADVPTEDTIQQLSRWYGYRGRHLEFCRVFTTEAIAAELGWIHTHDQELRSSLASLMQKRTTPREAGLVLSSIPRGLPTANIGVGKLKDISYSPWCRVLNFVEIGPFEAANEAVAVDLLSRVRLRGGHDVITGAGTIRGILSREWSFDEIIRLLDALQFTKHNPREDIAALGNAYRLHDTSRQVVTSLPEGIDIYSIAAYLRLWKAQADEEGSPLPFFNVGVARGSEVDASGRFDIPLANREVSRDGFVNGGWVGRSDGWPGDQVFDGIDTGLLIEDTGKRSEGAEGLLLLYVIHKDSRGRRLRGVKREFHSPILGISVPAGGPSFRRVILDPDTRAS